MSDVASTYKDLLAREMRGPSDTEAAMHRIQTKWGIDYWAQWSLRYRQPKRLAADLVERVRQASLSSLEQSIRRDIERLKIEAALGDADFADLIVEAESLLAKIAAKRVKP